MSIDFPKAKRFKLSRIEHPVLIEQKLDGHRTLLQIGFSCSRREDCLGQVQNKWEELPEHIQKQAGSYPIDGELIWPGHEASDVVTGLKEHPEELEFIGFHVFTPGYKYAQLEPLEHLRFIRSMGIKIPELFAPDYITDINVEELKRKAEEFSYEGWVLKEKIRYPFWHKLKLEWTYDLVIVGYKVSEGGKWKDKIGSIEACVCINNILYPVAYVSGMEDEVRLNLNDGDIGRVIEVKCNGIASKGRLRHPRFIRFRDDKCSSGCGLEQFDDAGRNKILKRISEHS